MRPRRRTPIWPVIVALMATFLGGCGPLFSAAKPAESFCNGVSTDVGGCGPTPSFAAVTCDSLAAEFGTAIDGEMLEIINGPSSAAGESRSIRIQHRAVVITTGLTDRMIGLGILQQCTMPAFLDRAAATFSADLRSRIGSVLYDGSPPATYADFIDRLGRIMSGIGKPP